MSWRQRLRRVFAIDIETCPDCWGTLRVITCSEDPPLIAKILGHLRSHEAVMLSLTSQPSASRRLAELS